MSAAPMPSIDPEATSGGEFLFGIAAQSKRQIVSSAELCSLLTTLMRTCEGCENVTVLEVYQFDRPDSRDGCNWSLALLLDPAGVAPEVYALAYGSVIAMARERYNLAELPDAGSVPDLVL